MRVFEEKQRFNQLWLYLLGITILIGVVFITYDWWASHKEQIDTSTSEFYIIMLAPILTILPLVFIYFLNLQTEIDEKGVSYRFFPFHRNQKTILWNEIKEIYTRKYSPVKEYGGWGIRGISKKNKAYNVRGNQGIQLVLKNGNRLLLGTQELEKAQQTINKYFKQ